MLITLYRRIVIFQIIAVSWTGVYSLGAVNKLFNFILKLLLLLLLLLLLNFGVKIIIH